MMIMLVFSYSTPFPIPTTPSLPSHSVPPFTNAVSCASLRRYVAIVLYYKKIDYFVGICSMCLFAYGIRFQKYRQLTYTHKDR